MIRYEFEEVKRSIVLFDYEDEDYADVTETKTYNILKDYAKRIAINKAKNFFGEIEKIREVAGSDGVRLFIQTKNGAYEVYVVSFFDDGAEVFINYKKENFFRC